MFGTGHHHEDRRVTDLPTNRTFEGVGGIGNRKLGTRIPQNIFGYGYRDLVDKLARANHAHSFFVTYR